VGSTVTGYDFSNKKDLSTWLAYANTSGATVGFDSKNNYGFLGGSAMMYWKLPSNFQQFKISFYHTYWHIGRIDLLLNDVIIATAQQGLSSVDQKMFYAPGSILKIQAHGAYTTLGYGLILNLYGDTCKMCLPGSYKELQGNQTCKMCPENSYSTEGASACECTAGAHAINSEIPFVCTPCSAGTHKKTTGPHECTLCPMGTYSTVTGAENIRSCVNCGKGKYNSIAGANSMESCIQCESGKFHRLKGANDPTQCEACKC
jgi:hypothetical protein